MWAFSCCLTVSPGGPGSPMSPSSPGSPWTTTYGCDEDKDGSPPMVFKPYSQCPLWDPGVLQDLGFPVRMTHLIYSHVIMEFSESCRWFYCTWGPRTPGKPTTPSDPCSPLSHMSEPVRCLMEKMLLLFSVKFHLLPSCSSTSKFTLMALTGSNSCYHTIYKVNKIIILTYWRAFNAQDTFYSSGTQFALSTCIWMQSASFPSVFL